MAATSVPAASAAPVMAERDITTFSSGTHQPSSTYASGGGDRGDRGAMSTGTARRGQAVDLASPGERGWKDVICPQGGPHEWEYFHRGNVSAGAVTGTAGVCSLLFCWPMLFCLPLLYVGTAKSVKLTSDRKCMRCGMVITHDGFMKAPPTGMPRINPATGEPNSTYGYGLTRRKEPPSRVVLEPTQEPELPAEAKARRDRERASVPVSRR